MTSLMNNFYSMSLAQRTEVLKALLSHK